MKKGITITFISILGLALNASASIVADYQFLDNASIPDSSDTSLLTTASAFTNGLGITMGGTSSIAVSNRSLLNNNNGFYALDEVSAVSGNDYLSFSVAVDAGYEIDYGSLVFASLRFPASGAGAPRSYSLRTDVDGFTSTVGTGIVAVAASDDLSEPFSLNIVDLSGVAELQSLTDTIEFRLYFYDRNTGASPSAREFRLDDVVVNGTVDVVPTTVVADYQFVDNASIPDSSDANPLSSAGTFTNGSGITMGGTSSIAVSNRSLLNNNNGFYALDEVSAVSGNDYFSFSVAVGAGYEIDYGSLVFATLRFPTTGAGAPRSYSLRTDVDGFAGIVGTGIVAVAASDDLSEPFAVNTIDLSGVSILQSMTNSVEFRLYFYDRDVSAAAIERQFRLDDVVVHGWTSAINSDPNYQAMYDAWATQYALGGASSPTNNPDNDLYLNWDEFVAGTDPTNAASFFVVEAFVPQDGGTNFVVEWNSIPSRLYDVYWGSDLIHSGFLPLATNITFPASSYTDTVHGVESDGFYRIDVKLE